MNIKRITEELLCSGCGTCNTICGHQAITMRKTSTMGLLYADIDIDKCTDCGLCLKMCPSAQILKQKDNITREQIIGNIKDCYIGRSLDKDVFDNAQSGGIVTTILTFLFTKGLIDAAVSCRMEYAIPTPYIHYTILTSPEELKQNQKSCYTQVDIVSALKETSQYKSVAVVGIPCHIQGVSNLIALKKYSNIKYRIGLICDKTYTDTYMDAIMYGEKIPSGEVRINYRQKNFYHDGTFYSYQQAPIVVENRKKEITIIPNTKRVFLKEQFAVPKCKLCWDKLNSLADIVLGDPWGLKGKYNENEGDSVIIVRSNLGKQLLNDLSAEMLIKLSQVSIEEVAEGQHVSIRVANIKKIDFEEKQKSWRIVEATPKELILKKNYNRYRNRAKYRLLGKMKRTIKGIIKH